MKMKYRTLYHRKSIIEINTLQCLHENERHEKKHNKYTEHANVSHENHNRN